MGDIAVLVVEADRSIDVGQIERINRMRGGFMHRAGRLIDPVSGPGRPAPVVESPGDDVEIGRPQMRMGRIHLALVGLDERTPGSGLFADPQHLELIPVAALNPLFFIGPHQGRVQRIKYLFHFCHSESLLCSSIR